MFSKELKDSMVEDAKILMMNKYPENTGIVQGKRQLIVGNCVISSLAVMEVLHKAGFRALLQAGSCLWRCSKNNDAAITHFGYVYGDSDPKALELSHQARIKGYLPEMHVWVALPDMNEIIDIETYRLPAICKSMLNKDWTAPKPPDYLWTSELAVLEEWDCSYIPNIQAIEELVNFLMKNSTQKWEITSSKAKDLT